MQAPISCGPTKRNFNLYFSSSGRRQSNRLQQVQLDVIPQIDNLACLVTGLDVHIKTDGIFLFLKPNQPRTRGTLEFFSGYAGVVGIKKRLGSIGFVSSGLKIMFESI